LHPLRFISYNQRDLALALNWSVPLRVFDRG